MLLPLVTIITPTYNRADLLVPTLESVLNQDYPNIEYIVLDDGSTDDTQDVVLPYLNRLKYFHHDNIGETATVNRGFSIAEGEIICVINSDDPLYVKTAVSTAVKSLASNPDVLMAYSDWVEIDKDGLALNFHKVPQYTLESMLRTAKVTIGPGMFIKKSSIEKIGPRNPNLRYIGDLDYSFRLAAAGKILHMPHFLATHRVHKNALSSSSQGRQMATEVSRLGEVYINDASLPKSIHTARNKILSRWYHVAASFSGTDDIARREYLKKSFTYSPLTALYMRAVATIRKPLGKIKRALKALHD